MNKDVLEPVKESFITYAKQNGLLETEVIAIYMDDIFLATPDVKSHKKLLEILFKVLSEKKLTVSINKSLVAKKSIHFLGSVIAKDTRLVQKERIHALELFLPPLTITDLRSMLGGFRYIADHVPKLNILLQEFDSQTGKVPSTRAPHTPFLWSWSLLKAFKEIKRIISNPQILFHFDPKLPLYLETDASNDGFGALLFQTPQGNIDLTNTDIRPLAYFSCKWKTLAEQTSDPCRRN